MILHDDFLLFSEVLSSTIFQPNFATAWRTTEYLHELPAKNFTTCNIRSMSQTTCEIKGGDVIKFDCRINEIIKVALLWLLPHICPSNSTSTIDWIYLVLLASSTGPRATIFLCFCIDIFLFQHFLLVVIISFIIQLALECIYWILLEVYENSKFRILNYLFLFIYFLKYFKYIHVR